jgi:hydroxymethylpyrimidine/phosphomethylpyrimidine kinase
MSNAGARSPIALTIAGSDPSGGAGIQADLKTFTAHGVYGASIITALTAQNTCGVRGVHAVPANFIRLQAEALAADLAVSAVKTGMIGDVATLDAVVEILMPRPFGPLVVDPVMVATSGDVLLAPEAIAAVRVRLVPLATLLTPNLLEAAKLLDVAPAYSVAEMERQARALLEFGPQAVLLKGGHMPGDEAIDVLAAQTGVTRFARPRIATQNTHGTGCTLSAAITAGLAVGRGLEDSVDAAKTYLWQALAAGRDLAIGHGRGPVDHAFALRQRSS